MLNQLESLTQRVGGSNKLIDQWLQERKLLLVEYYHLVGIKPNKVKHVPLDESALVSFCHHLVDYLSAGHFHIYDRIVEQAEGSSSPKLALAHKIYPKLKDNTHLIMEFHDRYSDAMIDGDDCAQLHEDLSQIGEHLASRFTMEDKLIQIAADVWESTYDASLGNTTSPQL